MRSRCSIYKQNMWPSHKEKCAIFRCGRSRLKNCCQGVNSSYVWLPVSSLGASFTVVLLWYLPLSDLLVDSLCNLELSMASVPWFLDASFTLILVLRHRLLLERAASSCTWTVGLQLGVHTPTGNAIVHASHVHKLAFLSVTDIHTDIHTYIRCKTRYDAELVASCQGAWHLYNSIIAGSGANCVPLFDSLPSPAHIISLTNLLALKWG